MQPGRSEPSIAVPGNLQNLLGQGIVAATVTQTNQPFPSQWAKKGGAGCPTHDPDSRRLNHTTRGRTTRGRTTRGQTIHFRFSTVLRPIKK